MGKRRLDKVRESQKNADNKEKDLQRDKEQVLKTSVTQNVVQQLKPEIFKAVDNRINPVVETLKELSTNFDSFRKAVTDEIKNIPKNAGTNPMNISQEKLNQYVDQMKNMFPELKNVDVSKLDQNKLNELFMMLGKGNVNNNSLGGSPMPSQPFPNMPFNPMMMNPMMFMNTNQEKNYDYNGNPAVMDIDAYEKDQQNPQQNNQGGLLGNMQNMNPMMQMYMLQMLMQTFAPFMQNQGQNSLITEMFVRRGMSNLFMERQQNKMLTKVMIKKGLLDESDLKEYMVQDTANFKPVDDWVKMNYLQSVQNEQENKENAS